MSNDIINREISGDHGRYVVSRPDGQAELTYLILPGNHILANHTGVPQEWRGQGIALELVKRLVADAQKEGLKIIPQCSYVAAQAKEHPEWADVFVQ